MRAREDAAATSARSAGTPGVPCGPASRPEGLSRITGRSVVLGALLVLVLVVTNPYLAFVVDYWTVGSGAVLNGPIAALFLLVLVNGALKRYLPKRAFRRSELLVAFAMASVCVGLAQAGGLPYITTTISLPFYMATPENRWAELIWPHLPVWLQPSDPNYASWFWEGVPSGAGVPWRGWSTPLLAWGSFAFALWGAAFCLSELIRRDWIERQRLTFPIVELPLAITGEGLMPSLRSSFLNNRLFWLGFAVPAGYVLSDWVNLIFPSFPAALLHDIEVGRLFAGRGLPWSAWSDIYLSIIFPVIGISYLVPTQVSLSIWLFYVLFQLHMLGWAIFGVPPWGGGMSSVEPRSFAGFMEAGGAVALAGVILFRSRGSLRAAAASLFGRDREGGDPFASLSPRGALLGFLLANGFMYWWMARAGVCWWGFALLLGLGYASMLCAGLLVASGGVMFPDYSFPPSTVLLRTLGGTSFRPASLAVLLSVNSIFLLQAFATPLPQMLQSSKLLHRARIPARGFAWAACLATVVTIAFGLAAILIVVHWHGASALDQWPWTWPNWSIYVPLAANLRDPAAAQAHLRLAMGAGAAVVLLTTYLQSRCMWWPLSPYGFVIASTYMTNHMMWASVFIGWLAATLVLRYGGLRLFRSLQPIALGLVLGYYITKLPITMLSAIFGVTQRWGLFAY